MNKFEKFYHTVITEAEVRKKLENFSEILNSNEDLKIAMELCIEIERLESNSEALIVGGSVRDLLLKKLPKDIDIATNVDINKISEHFKSVDIGRSKEFGIISVSYKGKLFEVAHYRTDSFEGETNSRHPSSIKLTKSFEGDSSRRDITINSLGLNTKGEIVDYQGGLDDLQAGIIRAVGKPKDRFIEDALRMLRVGRFMARYGFKLDNDTKQAIIELKHLITKVSPERVRDELFKSASNGKALANYIEHLKDVGLLKLILPEIDVMDQFEQSVTSHPEGDVFRHTMSALRTSRSNDPVTNIAILFHDIHKPLVRSYDDTGKVAYKGHEDPNLGLITKVLERLKFSNDQKESIIFALQYHMIGHKLGELKKSKLLSLRQNKNWDILKHTIYSDEASRGPIKFNPQEHEAKMQKVEDVTKQFGDKQAFEKRMSGYVDGRTIMDIVPKIKGTDIGKIKDSTREWIIQHDFNVSKDDTTKYIQHLARELGYHV